MAEKFRKKPVVIEAIQLRWENWNNICDFVGVPENGVGIEGLPDNKIGMTIKTLEGEMRANQDDWIIKGIAGEFYPCKPDIFEKTYEPVNE